LIKFKGSSAESRNLKYYGENIRDLFMEYRAFWMKYKGSFVEEPYYNTAITIKYKGSINGIQGFLDQTSFFCDRPLIQDGFYHGT